MNGNRRFIETGLPEDAFNEFMTLSYELRDSIYNFLREAYAQYPAYHSEELVAQEYEYLKKKVVESAVSSSVKERLLNALEEGYWKLVEMLNPSIMEG